MVGGILDVCVVCDPIHTKFGQFDGGFKLQENKCECKYCQKCGLKSFVGLTKNK